MAAELKLLSGVVQSGESNKAIQACNDWLRMGPGRTLNLLLGKYAKTRRITPPTDSIHTLKEWSERFKWAGRAAEYDNQLEEQKNAERERIMNTGYALDYERVTGLGKMARFLERQLYEKGADGNYHNVWVPDVKQVGSGENAERVDIEKFNAPIFDQLRGAWDDLAKETGGRVKRSELSGPGGKPIQFQRADELTDDQLAAIALAGSDGTTGGGRTTEA